MGKPEHPDTTIVENEFYPSGLTEHDVWEYYQSNKERILKEVEGRDLIFFVMVDVNKPVVLRAGKTSKFIRLNSANYDTLVHPRVISIHSTMKAVEEFGIIDIDCDDFDKAKKATGITYQYLLNVMVGMISEASIKYTGKTSFHIVCNFRKKMNVDTIRTVLRKMLETSRLTKDYTVSGKRTPGIPNLDLAPNKFRGGFITTSSLSVVGLKCMDVPFKDLMSFKRETARI